MQRKTFHLLQRKLIAIQSWYMSVTPAVMENNPYIQICHYDYHWKHLNRNALLPIALPRTVIPMVQKWIRWCLDAIKPKWIARTNNFQDPQSQIACIIHNELINSTFEKWYHSFERQSRWFLFVYVFMSPLTIHIARIYSVINYIPFHNWIGFELPMRQRAYYLYNTFLSIFALHLNWHVWLL